MLEFELIQNSLCLFQGAENDFRDFTITRDLADDCVNIFGLRNRPDIDFFKWNIYLPRLRLTLKQTFCDVLRL